MEAEQLGAGMDRAAVAALPEDFAHLAQEPELAEARNQEIRIRRAEAAKLTALLDYRARKLQEHQGQHAFTRAAVEKAIVRDAALVLTATESAVRRLLECAEFLQEKLPQTWGAYAEGAVDWARAQRIAQAAEDIAHREDLLPVLDEDAKLKAPGMNRAEVDQWVKRRVPELDAEAYSARCERARSKRYVVFAHLDDGMTKIDAMVPTVSVAALERHLWARAQARIESSAQGAATLTQRVADEFVQRLQGSEPTEIVPQGADSAVGSGSGSGASRPGSVNAKISILVPAETLLGNSEAPAVSEDKSFVLPASDVRQIAHDPQAEHDWLAAGIRADSQGSGEITSIVPLGTRYPLEGWDGASALARAVNLLDTSSRSRFVSGQLREAILTRDRTCQAHGCTRPAWRADVDHKTPHDQGGGTTPQNTWVLCRGHHIMKSHRLLPVPGKDPPQ